MHCGALICRWHGLAIDGDFDEFGWSAYPSYDDGVLSWVRLDAAGGEAPLDRPVMSARPIGETFAAATQLVGTCEPLDIIANRLDPWHGAWFHPYSFTRLEVLTTPTEESDRFLVAVTFRIGRLGVPVVAEFTSPQARCIVMRIVDGEGTGSVVETHATPLYLRFRRPTAHRGDRSSHRPVRPRGLQAGADRGSPDQPPDAVCGRQAVARRLGLRRAALPAARRHALAAPA